MISGVGLGLGYIVPTTMLQKWFPSHRALAAGVATGGFGLGSVIGAPLMRALVAHFGADPARALLVLGAIFLVTTLTGAAFFRNPPQPAAAADRTALRGHRTAQALRTPQWYLLTVILLFNTAAGISMLSVVAPAAGSLTGLSPTAAAALTGALGVFNTVGRPLWGWLSRLDRPDDRLRADARLAGALPDRALPGQLAGDVPPLAALVCLSFGGGFATAPAVASEFFGLAHVGAIYGLMLIGWSLACIFGPLLVSRLAADSGYGTAFLVLGTITVAAAALPWLTSRPKPLPA